ncbi:hypothetical protein VPH35_044575 [Triticum aestivum]
MKEGFLLSGSYNKKICIWDLKAGNRAPVLDAQQVFEVAVKASSWLRPSTTSSSCTSSATRTTEFRRFTDDTYIQPDMRMNEQGTGRWIFRSCIDRAKASCVEQFRSCTAIAVARLMATGCSTHGRQARCPRSRCSCPSSLPGGSIHPPCLIRLSFQIVSC